MSELIVITYPDPASADQVARMLQQLQAAHLLHLDDLVVVRRDETGPLQVRQSVDLRYAHAASGAFWGTLIGKLFGAPAVGAGLGTAAGYLLGLVDDYGINDQFVKELSAKLAPGTSAVFVLVRKATPDKVLPELTPFGGTVLHTSLDDEREEHLQAALSAGERKAAAQRAAARRPHLPRRRRLIR